MKGCIVFTLGTFALIACLIQPAFGANNTTIVNNFCPVQITAEPNDYVITMSSTVGIGLTPALTLSSIDPSKVQYKWATNYGFFLDWSAAHNFTVKKLGATTTNTGDTIFWSYSIPAKLKKNVTQNATVTVIASDKKTKKIIGKAFIPITWNETFYSAGNSTCTN